MNTDQEKIVYFSNLSSPSLVDVEFDSSEGCQTLFCLRMPWKFGTLCTACFCSYACNGHRIGDALSVVESTMERLKPQAKTLPPLLMSVDTWPAALGFGAVKCQLWRKANEFSGRLDGLPVASPPTLLRFVDLLRYAEATCLIILKRDHLCLMQFFLNKKNAAQIQK